MMNSLPQYPLKIEDGSKIGVVGGGPAGSFFSYFLLDFAQKSGVNLNLDIYEPKDFFQPSPRGCNKCGGIISETLVQNLAAEGINLPPEIIQRGIESYTLHTDSGTVVINTPLDEKRIGAVHRGCGPKDIKETKWGSFDGFLLILAMEKGAKLHQNRVKSVQWNQNKPTILAENMTSRQYDLIAICGGINSGKIEIDHPAYVDRNQPRTTRTFIGEYLLGEKAVSHYFGDSMHLFLLDLPRIEFAAFIPKGDYVTLCILGDNIDNRIISAFLKKSAVRNFLPPQIADDHKSCNCVPLINIRGAAQPFGDRLLFIGDCGITRLYKDGIGAAYKTAKAGASTAIFQGISENDFRKYYWPVCRKINSDNRIGKFIFSTVRYIQKASLSRKSIFQTVRAEQANAKRKKVMSSVLWDMFTGSASYREIMSLIMTVPFMVGLIRGFWNAIGFKPEKT